MPRVREVGSDGVMGEGRRGENDGVHERSHLLMAGKGSRPAAQGHRFGLGGMRIGDADQFHVRQRGQDASVFLAQMTDADHSHPQTLHTRSSFTRPRTPGNRRTRSSCS